VTAPSHAGGVVVRRAGRAVQCLVVSSSSRRDEWVLPKGRIEPGESPEEAALREVLEESGVAASIAAPLDVIEYETARGVVRAQFFLMLYAGDAEAEEDRRTAWLSLDEALSAVSFAGLRALIRKARAAVQRLPASF
jgi:8-oxo-dGTP pyrophosphatase MutT (NUDIX family)